MIVFLHGVPETARFWDALRDRVDGESTALVLPGFGSPRPEGFGATKDDYVAWTVEQLEAFGEPVDLVGHDWGAGFTYRIATAHGELCRSWVADVPSIIHPDQEWHEFAKIWQTPGEGEEFIASMLAQTPEEQAPLFEGMGLTRDAAVAMAEGLDETMGGCILDLYRSAVPNNYADWGGQVGPTSSPGLIVHCSDDPFTNEARGHEVAEMLGCEMATLDGVGHFWPEQAPDRAAEILNRFWTSLAS